MENEPLNNDDNRLVSIKRTVFNDSALIITQPNTNNAINYAIKWKDAVFQILASCVSFTTAIQAGLAMSFSAILLPQLNDKKTSDISITKSQSSWIASLMPIALPLGALIIGPLVDKFGRKKMCIISMIPFSISWLMHAYAKKVWHLYLARMLAGFSGGLTTSSIIYVSEITHPDYRTMLLSLNSVFVSFGILGTCCLGLWFTWRAIAIFNTTIAAISLIAICFLPESPHWHLVFKNNSTKASKSLKWLYRSEQIYEKQYDRIIDVTTTSLLKPNNKKLENNLEKKDTVTFLTKMQSEWKLYTSPIVYKPFFILITIFLFQQMSCAYVIIFHAVDLFREIGGHFKNGLDEFVALVLLGVIRFAMAIICCLISKHVGRRTLFLISGIGMCFTSFVAGIYMYLSVIPPDELAMLHIEKDQSSDGNIVLYCVLGYVCFSSLGYLVIPWTLTGELLPVKVRGVLSGFMISLGYILLFITVKFFPYLLDLIRLQVLFYGLALINLFGALFIFFCLPETLGKSFKEIEVYFK